MGFIFGKQTFVAFLPILCLLLVSQTVGQLTCGERKISTAELIEGRWPWQAAIYHKRDQEFEYICDGTILDSKTILTAAHCMYTSRGLLPKDQIAVHLGRTALNSTSDHIQIHSVSSLIAHPNFTVGDITDDIGLIQLSRGIMMTNYIQPVCLWHMDDGVDWITEHTGAVAGFGETENGEVSNHLHEVIIDVVDHWTCISSDRAIYGAHLTPKMICGKGRNNVSACKGDRGGGLVYEIEGRSFIRGIVSFIPLDFMAKCDVTQYTVFTDVAKYSEWIGQFVDATASH